MGRIIKTGTAGKDRILLQKGIVLGIRELARQPDLDLNTRDIVAYIALSLVVIGETIDESVAAWEKRGYWIKADRYRMEWHWAGVLGEELQKAIIEEDWGKVIQITGQVSEKLSRVKIAQRNRLGTPWTGSYEKLIRPKQGH